MSYLTLIYSFIKTKKIMWQVVFALIPTVFVGVYFQGKISLIPILVCTTSSVLFELIYGFLFKRKVSLKNGSAFLTGLLLALTMPSTISWYICVIASFFAIIVGKQLFGGFGRNVFNPALFGRVFVFILFPLKFSSYIIPSDTIDALSSATPLMAIKSGSLAGITNHFNLYRQLFIGNHGGCIGETSVIALIIGASYLFWNKRITWPIPLSFIISSGIFGWILGGSNGFGSGDGFVHILSGGVILGAFFMATDYITAPRRKYAGLIFGFLCGFITIAIRVFSFLPEGVMYSILIMNPFAKVLDRIEYRLSNKEPLFSNGLWFGNSSKNGFNKWIKNVSIVFIMIILIWSIIAPILTMKLKEYNEKRFKESIKIELIKKLYPYAESINILGTWEHHGETLAYYKVYCSDTNVVGYAVESCGIGYNGIIKVFVAIKNNYFVKDILIESQNETKNLGTRITENKFLSQFKNRPFELLKVTTTGENKLVEAISMATISSRAVTEDAVKSAVNFIKSLHRSKKL